MITTTAYIHREIVMPLAVSNVFCELSQLNFVNYFGSYHHTESGMPRKMNKTPKKQVRKTRSKDSDGKPEGLKQL